MKTSHLFALMTVPATAFLLTSVHAAESARPDSLNSAELLFFLVCMGLLIVGLRGLRQLRHHRFMPPRSHRPAAAPQEPETQ